MKNQQPSFLTSNSRRNVTLFTSIASVIYLGIILFIFPPGNPILFGILVLGEIFHTWQALTYLYTVWNMNYKAPFDPTITPQVDVLVPVAGEPVEIIEETLRGILQMDYPHFNVFILNDGYVTNKPNWQEVEALADYYKVTCITRTTPGGAKAGNINNGLLYGNAPLVAIFDADHVPHLDFLRKTVGYFVDERMGFVQTPQYYKNYKENIVTRGAWEQQELFYGPICRGKNRLNAVTMCGTNMVIRREGLLAVGGMSDSIAEDLATGMLMHDKGWKSTYVAEILAEGLAPEDFLSYDKQQYRWARGALDVIFKFKLLSCKGLTWAQKIQYLSSVSFFLSGIFFLLNISLPLIFLYTGLIPIQISGMLLATIFLPYIFLTLYNLSLTSGYRFTFRALAFATGGFWIHARSFFAAATKRKSAFVITSKKGLEGNFTQLVIPHLLYIGLVIFGVFIALMREGLSPSVVNNISWAAVNIGTFAPFIFAAGPRLTFSPKRKPSLVPSSATA